VAGLTFVDAATPDLVGSTHFQPFLGSFAALSHAAAGVARAGLLKPFSFTADSIGLPPEAAAEKRWAFADGRHNRTSAAEVAQWSRAAEQASAAGASLDPKLPVAVITAARGAGGHLEEIYAGPARQAEHGYFANVDGATHADLLGLRFADEIVKGVDFVLAAAARSRVAAPTGAMAGS